MKPLVTLIAVAVAGLFLLAVSQAKQVAQASPGMADAVTVRSLDNGGKLIEQHGFQSTFGSSKLSAERALAFSPDGKLLSASTMQNVVVEGGGLAQPLFMPEATLATAATAQPTLVSPSVTTARHNELVTYTGHQGIICANGVSIGADKMCLDANYTLTTAHDGEHLVTTKTPGTCTHN
jgi:hypothetical protein